MENYTKDKVGNWGNCETARGTVSEEVPSCEHCFSVNRLTKHHLVPKSARRLKEVKHLLEEPGYNKNATMLLCEKCHVELHQLKNNKNLALKFNTPEKVVALLKEWNGRSAWERLNNKKLPVYVNVFEGSNMWN